MSNFSLYREKLKITIPGYESKIIYKYYHTIYILARHTRSGATGAGK